MMTNDEIRNYYRKAYGLSEDETYDPDMHEFVPALAFGELIPDNDLTIGDEMDLEDDLMAALWAGAGSGAAQ